MSEPEISPPPSSFSSSSSSLLSSSSPPSDIVDEHELSGTVRIASAAVGALMTSLLATPFDVIKTRLQAQFHYKNISSSSSPSPSSSSSLSSTTTTASSSVSTGGGGSLKSAIHAMHSSPPSDSLPSLSSSPSPSPSSSSSSSSTKSPSSFSPSSSELISRCRYYRTHDGFMDAWTFERPYPKGSGGGGEKIYPLNHPSPLRLTGAFDAAYKLIRYEGLTSLWRGLQPTLIMSIPATVFYFATYDTIKLSLEDYNTKHNQLFSIHSPLSSSSSSSSSLSLVPLIAGSCARAFTTTLVSPIELVRTRLQAASRRQTMIEILSAEINNGGIKSLWRGASPTLWRDVPFSAIYWLLYEKIRSSLLQRWIHPSHDFYRKKTNRIMAAFVSGAVSGMIASTITHPFDIVKTRRQILLYQLAGSLNNNGGVAGGGGESSIPHTTRQVLGSIIKEEGFIGLWTGWSARIAKIVPSCAIMISSYETSKQYFGIHSKHYQQIKHTM